MSIDKIFVVNIFKNPTSAFLWPCLSTFVERVSKQFTGDSRVIDEFDVMMIWTNDSTD